MTRETAEHVAELACEESGRLATCRVCGLPIHYGEPATTLPAHLACDEAL